MKVSRYNWVVFHDKQMILYNGYTGALAVILEKNYPYIEELRKMEPMTSCDGYLKGVPGSLAKNLIDGGYVIADDRDELLEMQVLHNTQRYSSLISGITAVVTTYCNFACTYCYEGISCESKNVIESEVIRCIASLASESYGDEFYLALYGGEPLTALDECIELLAKVAEAVVGRDAQFGAGIVTNGYLMTPDVARKLVSLGVREAQITLDGTQELHDSRRVLRNGQGTFNKILDNIRKIPSEMTVKVRMNIDQGLDQDLREVTSQLHGLSNVSIHPAPTRYDHINLNSVAEVNQEYVDRCYPEYLINERLNARILGCVATTLRGMVIMPDGSILKCWNEVGDDHSNYGNIKECRNPNLMISMKWMQWDPYSLRSVCSSCKKLPQCCGGCPMEFVKGRPPRCRFKTDESFKRYIIQNYKHLTGQSEPCSLNTS